METKKELKKLKQEIYAEVEKLYYQRVGISNVQKRLQNNLGKDVPIELIREIMKEVKKAKGSCCAVKDEIKKAKVVIDTKKEEKADGGLKELAKADDGKKNYDVSERHYIFYKDGEPYNVLISTVRAIWSAYSKNGEDLSGEEIRQKFKLPAGIFELIKNSTGLYKSSHVDDPVTLSRLSGEGLEDYIQGRVESTLEDKYIAIYDRAVKGKQKRDLSKLAKSNRGYEIFIDKLEEAIKRYEPKDYEHIDIPKIKNSNIRDVFITDAHIGKLGTDGIVVRFKKLTEDLLSTPEKYVNITFGGDMGECLLPYGEMHPGQRLGMEDIETSDLIMLIVDVFEQMLLRLYKSGKQVTFNGMLGNHDRFTEKKEFDPHRTPAVVVYKFLQRLLENTSVKVDILKDKASVIKSGQVKYIFIHGDGLSPAELNRRAINEMEDGYYIVIVSGDKHHYKMSEISDRVLWIQSPALAGPGKYDQSLAMSSLPGAVEFTKNRDGLIDFIVRRYK